MEGKLEGYSVLYDRGFVGNRVDMVAGLFALGVDSVTAETVEASASVLISVVICY